MKRMLHTRKFGFLLAMLVVLGFARGASAQAHMIFLGMAHVDGPTDHDDVKVGDRMPVATTPLSCA